MGYIRTSDNTCRIAFEGLYGARPVVNVFYVNTDEADYTEANLLTVMVSARDSWQSQVMDDLTNNYVFTGLTYLSLDLNDQFAGGVIPNAGLPTTGAITTDSAPPNVAFLVHKVPIGAPRGFRPGRSYLCGVPEASIGEGGGVNTAVQDSINSNVAAFHATLDDPGGAIGNMHVVPSWPNLAQPPPSEPTPVEASAVVRVFGMTCDPLCATQRRRLRP